MQTSEMFSAIIVAAGKSTRMGFDKLFFEIEGNPVLWHSIQTFAKHANIAELIVVVGENRPQVEQMLTSKKVTKPYKLVQGGACRALSVQAGVQAASQPYVAIHDGARPFVSEELITNTIQAALRTGAAVPALPVKDTVKLVDGNKVEKTIPRDHLRAVQTPQIFHKKNYTDALKAIPVCDLQMVTDDCMVMEYAGRPVELVEGEEENLKITTPQDLPAAKKEKVIIPRIGHGFDVHRLVEGRKLVLGGVTIPYEKGLLGHSDADVVLHAISDALLGACALGDIGKHFPDTAAEYKNADSVILLQQVVEIIKRAGFYAHNIDVTILCQAPKLAPYIVNMRETIALALQIEKNMVSVKATTEEGLGYVGEKLGISAHCVAMVLPS